jgi:hypothetical protein
MATTFLDIINKVLTAIDAMPVSQIDDTVESEQVADIVRRAYTEILTHRDWDFLKKQGTLTPTYETPNTMFLPEDCMSVIVVKYNKKEIAYKDPVEFKNMLDSRTGSNVDANGAYTDKDPKYYTTYDGFIVTFDAYNLTESSNLLESKTYVYYIREPNEMFGEADEPDCPSRFIPALVDYSIAIAMNELRQDMNSYGIYRNKYQAQISRLIRLGTTFREDKDRYDLSVDCGRKRRY